ncbi:MAG: tetratricopeptide repeat protein [Chloroflexia bacterium]|nr:tetratricopeptide repeat protein [Chloroflexia bacterium]
MKRIALLFVSVFVGAALLSAQTQTAESLLKDKEKSDADIQNPKKNVKSATWEKRGELFLDMAQFNTKGLYISMPQTGISGAELLVGKPQSIANTEKGEDWIYERVTLHFENGKLAEWEETKPLDENALDKAYEAYKKADELDDKGKFKSKSTTKSNIATLRGLYTNSGVKFFGEKKYKEAVAELKKALELDKYPKADADSVFNTGLVTYYVGVMAQNGGDNETAKEYYELCISKGYQEAAPYQSLAALYKEMGQPTKEMETLQAGFDKFPGSKEILIGFINYYLTSGESEKAMEKLTQAVEDNPENPTFHYAIGTLYDTMTKDTTGKYNDEQKKTFLGKAVESYKAAIELKPGYFEALYNIGALYYNEAARILKEADKLSLKQVKEFEAMQAQAKEQFELALPYMEKAHEADKSDRSTLQTLVTIYHKLQKYDKKKEAQEKLEQVPEKKSGL